MESKWYYGVTVATWPCSNQWLLQERHIVVFCTNTLIVCWKSYMVRQSIRAYVQIYSDWGYNMWWFNQYQLPSGLTEKWLNTLKPRQDGRHYPDDIFKCIFLNENVWISIKFSLKFVPKGPINNIPALVQIMAWRRPGDKPLSEPMMVRLPTHICVTRPRLFLYAELWVTPLLHAELWLFAHTPRCISVLSLPVVIIMSHSCRMDTKE